VSFDAKDWSTLAASSRAAGHDQVKSILRSHSCTELVILTGVFLLSRVPLRSCPEPPEESSGQAVATGSRPLRQLGAPRSHRCRRGVVQSLLREALETGR
jgi:hypothetical protein